MNARRSNVVYLHRVVELPLVTLDDIVRRDGDMRPVTGDAPLRGPLCDASHSTRYAVFALRVAAAIAFVLVLLVGALAVSP